MKKAQPTPPIVGRRRAVELLAPARTAAIAIEAIRHGADAVYMGASSHGARAAAGNSIADISAVVQYAHRFGARVYVTVNTIVYDSELAAVEQLVRDLYAIGVDALIVQDMALLRLSLPPIALHASTQCDIRTPAKARFLQDVGFSQLVLPRELTPAQIAEYAQAVQVPLEVFVHGALCVSYSGDCHASCLAKGRSANRGECAQICRLPYDVVDSEGRVVAAGKHALSLRDMCRIDQLGLLLDSGATSFKIEGRLKEMAYVKNVVGAYSQALDAALAERPGLYRRRSFGTVEYGFTPDVNTVFNRGFTPYFITRARQSQNVSAMLTPKWMGMAVATVSALTDRYLEVKTRDGAALANGDGLSAMARNDKFIGFRANRVERVGSDTYRIYPYGDMPAGLAPGATIYRNRDVVRDRQMEGTTATRVVEVDMRLWATPDARLALTLADDYGHRVTVTSAEMALEAARSPQEPQQRRVAEKLGDTDLRLRHFTTLVADQFIPAATLTALRRAAVDAFWQAVVTSHKYEYRLPEKADATYGDLTTLDYHSNVANALARQFYTSHGAEQIQPAQEVQPTRGETVVMTTRFCPLHDLGLCLRTPRGQGLRQPLYLQGTDSPLRLRLQPDCDTCTVKVLYDNR